MSKWWPGHKNDGASDVISFCLPPKLTFNTIQSTVADFGPHWYFWRPAAEGYIYQVEIVIQQASLVICDQRCAYEVIAETLDPIRQHERSSEARHL